MTAALCCFGISNVATAAKDSESVVTAVFSDEGGKTRFTATVRYPSRMVRDIVIDSGMARGAGISYDRLEDLVAELQRRS